MAPLWYPDNRSSHNILQLTNKIEQNIFIRMIVAVVSCLKKINPLSFETKLLQLVTHPSMDKVVLKITV